MRSRSSPGILSRLPLFLLVWGIGALAMYVPGIMALVRGNIMVAQTFFFNATIGLIIITMVTLARASRPSRHGTLGQLLALLATFALLPIYLAVPLYEGLGNTSYLNAYFDMVSSITTTGANLFDDPGRLAPSLHLWRALVAWLGGLLMWVAASAILAPLSLGGFEITARGEPGRTTMAPTQMKRADPRKRLVRITLTLAPVYTGLTLAVWLLLMIAGDRSLVAVIHAMSVMATSGISPVGGMGGTQSGVPGEAILFLFMFFALSRLTFSNDTATTGFTRLDKDPEFRIGLMLVIAVPLILFLRHWWASFEVDGTDNTMLALRALWGAIFTVLSFLTTTGFESADWQEARQWSGLGTPGMILLGLALIGGGVATTAGGVKLLRVYAAYLNGMREMEQLIHPHSVSSAGKGNRRIQKNGAFIAWVFFMLFAMSLALITVTLAALGSDFEEAMVLSIATLSTTGPLIDIASEVPIQLAELGNPAKAVLIAAMVLGRLETLAIIALFTPDLWRN